jgi:hypothetical protein
MNEDMRRAVVLRNSPALSDGRSLSSEPLWEAAVAFARTEVEHGVPGKDLLALAARSAEFDAANQL